LLCAKVPPISNTEPPINKSWVLIWILVPTNKPAVVVALPDIVSPPKPVPSPIVDEAYAVSPPLNCVSVVVALPAALKGYAPPPPPQPVHEATVRLPVSVALPALETEKSVVVAEAVDEPMAKRVVAVSPLLVWMANLANGEVVPRPILPAVGSLMPVDVAGRLPKIRLPMFSWLFAAPSGKNVSLPREILPLPVPTLKPALNGLAPIRMLEYPVVRPPPELYPTSVL